ncbi:hypothetical protein F4780DRAFT_794353 [Xylariomycetidae sp. FL0641]|nr:hypothetical protein F4780DRAFT_794353 [Xylariomycetidae sp. FL0641]
MPLRTMPSCRLKTYAEVTVPLCHVRETTRSRSCQAMGERSLLGYTQGHCFATGTAAVTASRSGINHKAMPLAFPLSPFQTTTSLTYHPMQPTHHSQPPPNAMAPHEPLSNLLTSPQRRQHIAIAPGEPSEPGAVFTPADLSTLGNLAFTLAALSAVLHGVAVQLPAPGFDTPVVRSHAADLASLSAVLGFLHASPDWRRRLALEDRWRLEKRDELRASLRALAGWARALEPVVFAVDDVAHILKGDGSDEEEREAWGQLSRIVAAFPDRPRLPHYFRLRACRGVGSSRRNFRDVVGDLSDGESSSSDEGVDDGESSGQAT